MIPNRLYIENFACYDFAYVDMTEFKSAVIVGKIGDNDMYSNGVGKTTIFNSIEYVLYNQSNVNMEKIIRDDTNKCTVTFDFIIDEQEYRISRARTRNGTTDLSLLKRNSVPGDAYHDSNFKPLTTKSASLKLYWEDISGRRASDTEKDIANLIKLNYTSFRSTVHFVQDDFTGLTTASPTDRKKIFKTALDLAIYAQLEKFAKDEYSSITKNIDKNNILISNYGYGDIESDLLSLKNKLANVSSELDTKSSDLLKVSDTIKNYESDISELNKEHFELTNKNSSLIQKKKELNMAIFRTESSLTEYKNKKSSLSKAAKLILEDIKELESLTKDGDFSKIQSLESDIELNKSEIANINAKINVEKSKLDGLMIPVPDDSICKHCRQSLSDEHKELCKSQVSNDIKLCKSNIDDYNLTVKDLNFKLNSIRSELNDLKSKKSSYDRNISLLSLKNNEVSDKREMFKEFGSLYEKTLSEMVELRSKLDQIDIDIKASSSDKAKLISEKIQDLVSKQQEIKTLASVLLADVNSLSNSKAIILHDIESKNKSIIDRDKLIKISKDLEIRSKTYPLVIQAFSSTGIPNFIIQGVLDDLQIETNKLLMQLKPGLQMQFSIEKINSKNEAADTLDINYSINGRERQFEQLSGGMRLAATFSLKIGLSIILQRILGIEFKFLLLDEVDKSLDRAGVDSFANIVKHFQEEYKIIIISHSDQLKDKFSHAILVQQNLNMVSSAKVVDSW